MKVVSPDGSLTFYDKKGTLRVRMGNLTQESLELDMYHMTLDGEYVTGFPVVTTAIQVTQWAQIREEFGHTQAWCKTGTNDWYTVPACNVGRGRWEGVEESNVPECVRMAEILR